MSYLFNNKIDFIDTAKGSFGRLITVQPYTLFDSSHRYRDNELWVSGITGGTAAFNAAQGLIDLTIGTTANCEIIRETKRVFSYQPGKSLKIFNTFVMEGATVGLRQRVGYYGKENGIFLELDGSTLGFVKRSNITGSPVDTKVNQEDWNIDKLDGNGPSGLTFDISKAQIFWTDLEWLGVGTVRSGFVIDGSYIHCHSFHHANTIESTYMTTASLPLRYEIKNTSDTGSSSTFKQICSTVLSEGGYQLYGTQQSIGTAITTPKSLTVAGTYYPLVSIRLKSSPDRLDAIVILSAASVLPIDAGEYSWRIIDGSVTTVGGSWVSAGTNSAVEYNITGTGITGTQKILASGYLSSTNQTTSQIEIPRDVLFKFQLERNSLTNTPTELILALSCGSATVTAHGSLDWEEISR